MCIVYIFHMQSIHNPLRYHSPSYPAGVHCCLYQYSSYPAGAALLPAPEKEGREGEEAGSAKERCGVGGERSEGRRGIGSPGAREGVWGAKALVLSWCG